MAKNDFGVPACLVSAVLILVGGCGERSTDMSHVTDVELPEMSFSSSASVRAAWKTCEDACKILKESSDMRTFDILKQWEQRFRNLKFDNSSYASRVESLEEYFKLVTFVSDNLYARAGISDQVWNFKIAVLDRVNQEIQNCENEPVGGPYGNLATGDCCFLTQREYLSMLKKLRFQFIREGFEYGSFTKYYHSLSADKQSAWTNRIATVAHRQVVIWDPENQFIEMPRYVPEDTRQWLNTLPGRPREYLEEIGDGKKIRMKTLPKSVYYSSSTGSMVHVNNVAP